MFKKLIAGASAAAVALGLFAGAAPGAQATSKPATILDALAASANNNRNGSPTDSNAFDHDILLQAALALGLDETLTGFNGTVFAPTDLGFRRLVADLTNQRVRNVSEAEALNTLVAIAGEPDLNGTGISGAVALTETVKYHVTAEQIPGLFSRNRSSAPIQTITDLDESLSDGTFDLRGGFFARLADNDTNDRDPRYFGRAIRAADGGNIYVINRVLRPLDLQILFPGD